MILKERDLRTADAADTFAKAGAEAEEQLAHYLHRAFVDNPDIWVFNDLRYRDSTDDVAQIDHLILHKYGFILIESKSVTSEVIVNKQGEWARIWNGRRQGMPSPIAQVKRQCTFLQRALDNNIEELMGKLLGMQKRLGGFSWECLVAISDRGLINRPNPTDYPEVCKADLITGRILEIHRQLKRRASPFSLTEPALALTAQEMERIKMFLLAHHYPRTQSPAARVTPPKEPRETMTPQRAPRPSPAPSPVLTRGIACPGCGSETRITWGRYGYYWKCPSCDKNTPLQETCVKCGKKPFLRKDGNHYFARCETCGTAEILYATLG